MSILDTLHGHAIPVRSIVINITNGTNLLLTITSHLAVLNHPPDLRIPKANPAFNWAAGS